MANEAHFKILKQGVDKWNEWREAYPELRADLSNANLVRWDLVTANLIDTNLTGALLNNANLTRAFLGHAILVNAQVTCANFTDANLRSTNFSGATVTRSIFNDANLTAADFRNANLHGAYLAKACLQEADFSKANLSDANLSNADLSNARLDGTDLTRTNFNGSRLQGTSFNGAVVDGTIFSNIDLREATDLASVVHRGPSTLSSSTLIKSAGEIARTFLRGCGLRDWELEAAKLHESNITSQQIVDIVYKISELRSDPLIQFHSCFISFSSKDEEFARRLHSNLQKDGVRCWFAPEDMKIGDRIRDRIDESIHLHNKLLLILSSHSVTSQWIEQEVETALGKEREQHCDVLFPIRVDDSVLTMQRGWPALIKNTRHIGDFCGWDNYSKYRESYNRLLNDLRVGIRRKT